MGGLWEAAVKSVKKHFIRVIGTQNLTFEECSTLLTLKLKRVSILGQCSRNTACGITGGKRKQIGERKKQKINYKKELRRNG